ncbi:MAG: TonB C-terminal domain-containing protein [Gammaproteobacteria bacterium]|nr:TonB C-terminal domain-containing protein [Gammaproteobacteria bacterium]
MKVTSISKAVLAISAIGAFAVTAAANAGQPDNMAEWKAEANASINKVMTFPSAATHRAATGQAQFTVTIDRDGRLIATKQTLKPHSFKLNFAAKKALRRARFPDLPKSYTGEKLTFTLNMNYQSGRTIPYRGNLRDGTVSGSEVASRYLGHDYGSKQSRGDAESRNGYY